MLSFVMFRSVKFCCVRFCYGSCGKVKYFERIDYELQMEGKEYAKGRS